MKKIIFTAVLLFAAASITVPAWAQIYKYQTTDGAIFYTNDINQVPMEYRNQVQDSASYEMGVQQPSMTQTTTDSSDSNTASSQPDQSGTGGLSPDMEMTRARLEATKDDLARVYADLTARQSVMEEMRGALIETDANAVAEFNSQLNALNQEIETYKQRSQAYNEEVKAYNQNLLEQSQ